MKQVLQQAHTGEIMVAEVPAPALLPVSDMAKPILMGSAARAGFNIRLRAPAVTPLKICRRLSG